MRAGTVTFWSLGHHGGCEALNLTLTAPPFYISGKSLLFSLTVGDTCLSECPQLYFCMHFFLKVFFLFLKLGF